MRNFKKNNFSFDYMDDIFISAMLMLLGLPGDEETINFLHKNTCLDMNDFNFMIGFD